MPNKITNSKRKLPSLSENETNVNKSFYKRFKNIESLAEKNNVVHNRSKIHLNIIKNYTLDDKSNENNNTTSTIKPSSIKQSLKLERIKLKKQKSLPAKHPDAERRTIYVGNVKAEIKRVKLEHFFSKYGKIETIRIRGVAAENMNVSKKEAITKGKLHPDRKTVIAYIRFKDEASCQKALEANGEIFEGLHIRVDNAYPNTTKNKNSIFIGNLPFETEDEDLWIFFGNCGEIEAVRVVRSAVTGAGKGFGFVTFKSKDSLDLALHLNGKTIKNRPIRVKRIAKKEKKVAVKRKRKCATSSLVNESANKKANKLNLSFMKQDKPRGGKKIKFAKKKNKERKNINNTDFIGTKISEESKTAKKGKKPRKSRVEKKKMKLAKILDAKTAQ